MININLDLIYGYVLWIYRLNFEFGCGFMIFDRVMFFELSNLNKCYIKFSIWNLGCFWGFYGVMIFLVL